MPWAHRRLCPDQVKGGRHLRRDKEHYLACIEEITAGHLARYRIATLTVQLLRAQVIELVQNAVPRKKREFVRRFIAKIDMDSAYCSVHDNQPNLTAPLDSGLSQAGNPASPKATENEPSKKAVRLQGA